MIWNMPVSVKIDDVEYDIRNKCDYRVVLDVINALGNTVLDFKDRLRCALYIFYDDISKIGNIEAATYEMMNVINLGEKPKEGEGYTRPLMDWEKDFKYIAPAVNRVLGYDVRDSKAYTHWYTFVGAYMEIGDCAFATIIRIRKKRRTGQKMEKWEMEFYTKNQNDIDLPLKLTKEQRAEIFEEY